MTVHHLEDFAVGQILETDALTVTESMIIDFAMEFDPQPLVTDTAAARNSMFCGLAASGWHTCAIAMGMVVHSGLKIANRREGSFQIEVGDDLLDDLRIFDASDDAHGPAPSRQALGTAVFGGMIAPTILVVVCVPVFFVSF